MQSNVLKKRVSLQPATVSAAIKAADTDEKVMNVLKRWHKKGVHLLLSGDNSYLVDKYNHVPFSIVKVLMREGKTKVLLDILTGSEHAEYRKELGVDGERDIRTWKIRKFGLMHIAVSAGSVNAIDLLHKVGFSVNGSGEERLSPLGLAIHMGDGKIVKKLSDLGADWNQEEYIVDGKGPELEKETDFIRSYPWTLAWSQPNVGILEEAIKKNGIPVGDQWNQLAPLWVGDIGHHGRTQAGSGLTLRSAIVSRSENHIGLDFMSRKWWALFKDSGAYDSMLDEDERMSFKRGLLRVAINRRPASGLVTTFMDELTTMKMLQSEQIDVCKSLLWRNSKDRPSLEVLEKWFTKKRKVFFMNEMMDIQNEIDLEARSTHRVNLIVTCMIEAPEVLRVFKKEINEVYKMLFWRDLKEIIEADQVGIDKLQSSEFAEIKVSNRIKNLLNTFSKKGGSAEQTAAMTALLTSRMNKVTEWVAMLQWMIEEKLCAEETVLSLVRNGLSESGFVKNREKLQAWSLDLERQCLGREFGVIPAKKKVNIAL